MKIKLAALLVAAALMSPAFTRAQSAETNKTATAGKPAVSAVESELTALVTKIRAKIQEKKGKVTASDFQGEIKEFDAILAKHVGEKTEDVANVALMKATLYKEVLNDKVTADKLLQQFKIDYKGTKLAASYEKQEAAQAESEKAQEVIAPGKVFPDFNETDLAGKPLSVGNFKGKAVLIDFWATWCGPCVGELPNVIEVYKKYHSQGFEIIGISLDSDRAKLDAFLKKNEGMTWQQYFDGKGWENKISVKFGVRSIPFTVLVGPDGKVIENGLRGEALGEAVAKALKK
jgi:thiol-disulfide isomerase/thioredoxin